MHLHFDAYPNNRPFPISTVGTTAPLDASSEAGVQAMLMGPFAASACCLFTYQSLVSGGVALIADEMLHPRRSNYKGTCNGICESWLC